MMANAVCLRTEAEAARFTMRIKATFHHVDQRRISSSSDEGSILHASY